MRSKTLDAKLAADLLEAHPAATLLIDSRMRIAHANAAARRMLAAPGETDLGAALGCAEGAGRCGGGGRCGGCSLRKAVERALGGKRTRARGFVFRAHGRASGSDLHLLALAVPFVQRGRTRAIVAFSDATEIASDPRVMRVCGGCGRVAGDDGEWHRLDRLLEDRLGIEPAGPCEECASRLGS